MRVAALYAYPVKACAAVSLDAALFDPLGIAGDRRYAFVGADGRALTQREAPLLATVRPTLDAQALRLDFGGLLQVVVGLRDFAENTSVDVWGNRVAARAAPRGVVAPAAEYLGTPLRLVALDPAAQRAFTDSQPVLVATTEALSSLNGTLARPIGIERFRPNVVIEGAGEDWRGLRAGEVLLERTDPCGRCEVTTIDQASGERRGEEPLRTLNERFSGNFGTYCRVTRAGHLRVGEALQAL